MAKSTSEVYAKHLRNDPAKQRKLSPVDLEAREGYEEYTDAREAMLKTKGPPLSKKKLGREGYGRLKPIPAYQF